MLPYAPYVSVEVCGCSDGISVEGHHDRVRSSPRQSSQMVGGVGLSECGDGEVWASEDIEGSFRQEHDTRVGGAAEVPEDGTVGRFRSHVLREHAVIEGASLPAYERALDVDRDDDAAHAVAEPVAVDRAVIEAATAEIGECNLAFRGLMKVR